MDDATQKLVDEAPAWLDCHGDVWVFRNGMGWSFETQPFTREHIEKKWGPLVPLEAAQRPPVAEPDNHHNADVAGHDDYEAGYEEGFHHGRSTPAERPPVSPEVREALDELITDVLIAERDEWPRDPGDAPSEVLAGAVTDAILARFSVPSKRHVGDWDAERAEYVCSCSSALNEWWTDGMKISSSESAFDKWMRLHPAIPSQPVYDEEKIAQIVDQQMRGAGLSDNPAEFDSNIHSWSCEHPNRYGPCGCFQDMRSGLVAALVAALRGGELTREETNE